MKRQCLVLIISVLLGLSFVADDPGQIQASPNNQSAYVGGGIFEDTVWSASQSPYIVTDDVTLFPGYTLTIEPGVEVKFENGKRLTIRGILAAEGTVTDRIVFTSNYPTPSRGSWEGVYLATNLGGRADIRYADFSYASTAISVECCWGVAEPANIYDSTFRSNDTALGGYAGTVMRVDSCTFEDNMVAVNSADKEIINSLFMNNRYGLYETERISVRASTFVEHEVALWGGRGEVTHSTIVSNTTGVQAFFEGFSLSHNTVASNTVGVVLGAYDSVTPPVSYNNFFNNAAYNMKNTVSSNTDAKNNWWGTTDTGEIDASIYDGRDDASLGLIMYDPILTAPVDIPTARLAVGKTANVSSAQPGETITYTYRITNTGNVDLIDLAAVDDKLGNIPLDTTTLEPDAVATGSKSYSIKDGDLPGPIINTVVVSGKHDSLTVTDSATVSVALDDAHPGTGTIAGEVLDDDGAGIEGIAVTLSNEENAARSAAPMTAALVFTDTTKSDGSYQIDDVPVGTYTLTFAAQGYVSPDPATVEVVDGETQTADPVVMQKRADGADAFLHLPVVTNNASVSATPRRSAPQLMFLPSMVR